MKEFIGSQFADPRKVHAGLAKNNKFSLWIDTERLKTTNQNDESLGMVCALIHYLQKNVWRFLLRTNSIQKYNYPKYLQHL